ncbi:alpha/beta family hydrolase [Ruegeria jejuensis]|uniref:alpha/beta family hydrolase n=1 Tax=Ruegeria jejuensis TaxID=3233338 RepID=UPI00355B73AD
MAERMQIPLSYGDARSVNADLSRQEGRELALIYPGLRYTCERPLLRSIAEVFERQGCDVLRLQFRYADDHRFLDAEDDAQFTEIFSDGQDILAHALTLGAYQRFWMIGKSLGTLSMAGALAAHRQVLPDVRGIWLTPGLLKTPLAETLATLSLSSIMVLGTEDPCNLPELLAPYEVRSDIDLHLVEGMDHGFQHLDGLQAEAAAIAELADLVTNWVASQG